MSLKWSLTLISWIIFLSSIACVSIFIVCWFIWVFSPNPDARKEVIKFKDAELIIIFGSVLRGKEFNDVDVLFLTNQTKKVTDFCLEISKVRTKPVVPLIMKKEDLIKAMKNKKEAILSMIKEGVVLRGESIFVEVIKNVNS